MLGTSIGNVYVLASRNGWATRTVGRSVEYDMADVDDTREARALTCA